MDVEIKIVIGKMRDLRGMSLRQLALRSGVRRSTLHNYESGKTMPTADNLVRIALALQCDINDLIDVSYKKVSKIWDDLS